MRGAVGAARVARGAVRGDRLQRGARVAQREAAPGGEVGGRRGSVAGEVAARELGQRGIAIELPVGGAAPSQSRVSAKAWLPSSRSGPSTAMPAQGGEHQQVHDRLALGADAVGGDPLGELGARERPVFGERALDDLHRALGVVGRHALLPQAPAVRRQARGRGERQQPPIVVAPDEVQRAAHQPRDHHGALVGERGIDVAGGEAGRARAQGQARGAQVLGLHRQQVADDVRDACRARAVQQLGRRPGATLRRHPCASATTSAGVICGVTLRRGRA